MTQGSPSAYLLWALLAVIFQLFLVLHLWCYDRFQCIKWTSGRQPGTFKRVMTYSYLLELPLLLVFAMAMTVIKYREGYITTETGLVIPRPCEQWSETHIAWIIPLSFLLSVVWSLEIVTHLEELTFWLFLLHQGPSQRKWFSSWEFRVWYIGSTIALTGMPVTALVKRNDLTCIPWLFLVGSSAGSVTTTSFFYVLWKFPAFIRQAKVEGAAPDIIVRLTTFFQLNLIRVAFRVFFNFPLLLIGIDGVQGDHPIITSPFWSDVFFMLGGLGCFASSMITLLVFFPRSITQESGYTVRVRTGTPGKAPEASSLPEYQQQDLSPKSAVPSMPYPHSNMNSFRFPQGTSVEQSPHYRSSVSRHSHRRYLSEGEATPEYESDPELPYCEPPARQPQRRHPQLPGSPQARKRTSEWLAGVENGTPASAFSMLPGSNNGTPRWQDQTRLPDRYAFQPESGSAVTQNAIHTYVMNFTSPIDLLDEQNDKGPRAV